MIMFLHATALLLTFFVTTSASPFVGINFALNLQRKPLSKSIAANIVHRAGFTRAKIFSYNTEYMDALKNVGMRHLAVSIPNVELVGFDTSKANALVQKLTTFTDAGVTCDVIVGNEPLAPWYKGKYRNLVVPVFDLVKTAIAANTKADLTKIKITVAFHYGIIGKSYPPSQGYFTSTDREIVRQVATREVETGSPFFINIYPYFARQDSPKDISLDYALGNTGISKGGEVVRDYVSLLDAQVGAVRAALIALDASFGSAKLPMVLGETGWPTAGRSSADVSVANAKTFARNTIHYVQTQAHVAGAYLFEAFDESLKSQDNGAGSHSQIENHWGIYSEAGAAKYAIDLSGAQTTSTATQSGAQTTSTATTQGCVGPFSSDFPECEARIQWMLGNWKNPDYTEKGVDGSRCSIQNFLSTHEKHCPSVTMNSRATTVAKTVASTTTTLTFSPTPTTTAKTVASTTPSPTSMSSDSTRTTDPTDANPNAPSESSPKGPTTASGDTATAVDAAANMCLFNAFTLVQLGLITYFGV